MTQQLKGRQLDVAIAERCFNFRGKITVEVYGGTTSYRQTGPNYSLIPHYSTDMAAAWQVAEWIREQTNYFKLTWMGGWRRQAWSCSYKPADDVLQNYFFAVGDTAPEAVCHAALKLAEQLEASP